VADAILAELQRITPPAAGPIDANDKIKSGIARAARRLGINYRRGGTSRRGSLARGVAAGSSTSLFFTIFSRFDTKFLTVGYCAICKSRAPGLLKPVVSSG
jgi:hypothetical protein